MNNRQAQVVSVKRVVYKNDNLFSGGTTMNIARKNYNRGDLQVQDRFTTEAGKLFHTEHHGRDCTNSVFIRVLFCAPCRVQSLFAV